MYYRSPSPMEILTFGTLLILVFGGFFAMTTGMITVNIERPYYDQFQKCSDKFVDVKDDLSACERYGPNDTGDDVMWFIFGMAVMGVILGAVREYFRNHPDKKKEKKKNGKK